ncbi:MAG: hypothetical protein WC477_07265 [Patescibacteria group bacterium]
MPELVFDYKRWKRGASSSRFSGNRGFSSATVGIDMISQPGVLLPGVCLSSGNAGTALSNILAGGIIASCTPKTATAPTALVLTNNSDKDGRVVKMAELTESTLHASDTAHDYEEGISDIIEFKGGIYFTSHTEINKDGDVDWLSAVGSVGNNLTAYKPHQMCVVGDFLVIADGQYIHLWDGTTFTWQALDIPTGYVIMTVEEFDGKLYFTAEALTISTNPWGQNISSDVKMYVWDLIDPNSYNDEWTINQRVTAMRSHHGRLYVWTSTAFGYFDGREIQEIYPLNGVVYKHHIACVQSKIFFKYPMGFATTGLFDKIACYGATESGGSLVMTFPIMNDYYLAGDDVFTILPFGSSVSLVLAVFWRHQSTLYAMKLVTFPQTSFVVSTNAGVNTTQLEEDLVDFGMDVRIKRVRVVLSGPRPARETVEVGWTDQEGTSYTAVTISDTTYSGRRTIEKDVEVGKQMSVAHFWIRPFVTEAGASCTGVVRVAYEYEPVEGRRAR